MRINENQHHNFSQNRAERNEPKTLSPVSFSQEKRSGTSPKNAKLKTLNNSKSLGEKQFKDFS